MPLADRTAAAMNAHALLQRARRPVTIGHPLQEILRQTVGELLRMVQWHRDQVAALIEIPDQVRIADVADDGAVDQQIEQAVVIRARRFRHREREGDPAKLRRDRGGLRRGKLVRPADRARMHSHDGDRRRNLEVAVVGDPAGDEGEGALDHGEQRVVRTGMGVEHIVAERHLCVGNEIERGAVRQHEGNRRGAAGLDDVVLVDGIAGVQRHGDAVALNGDVADDLVDMADGNVIEVADGLVRGDWPGSRNQLPRGRRGVAGRRRRRVVVHFITGRVGHCGLPAQR